MDKHPDPDPEEDNYNESEDEDYSPDKPQAAGAEDADSDDEAELKKLDAAYAQYQGRGGLIKTRAQRRAEAEGRLPPPDEPKPAAVVGQSSVDVDALWQEMNAPPPAKRGARDPAKANGPAPAAGAAASATQNPSSTPAPASSPQSAAPDTLGRPAPPTAGPAATTTVPTPAGTPLSDSTGESSAAATPLPNTPAASPLADEYITITRTYKFAGSVKSEQVRVPKYSAEGQDYLRQEKLRQELGPRGRGPVKRKMTLMEEYKMNKAKKINTLEKSRMDWLGFVDKEGIKEDLTKYNKAGYLDRQDFLSRVDSKRDAELRQQRAKNMQ